MEARFHGGVKWFAGLITNRNSDGTFDVRYEDGDKEKGVRPSDIRALTSEHESQIEALVDKIRSNLQSNLGESTDVAERLGILFSDLDTNRNGGISKSDLTKGLQGLKIDVLMSEVDQLFRAFDRNRDGSIDFEEFLTLTGYTSTDATVIRSDNCIAVHRLGAAVEVRYRGGSDWVFGLVSGVNPDGCCSIRYEDGEEEMSVAHRHIRLPSDSGAANKDLPFQVGKRVDVRYKGKVKYFPGVIIRERLNGTFDIDYDDGEKELGVNRKLIRVDGSILQPVAANVGRLTPRSTVKDSVDDSSRDARSPIFSPISSAKHSAIRHQSGGEGGGTGGKSIQDLERMLHRMLKERQDLKEEVARLMYERDSIRKISEERQVRLVSCICACNDAVAYL